MGFKISNPTQLQPVEVQNDSDAPVPVAIISGGGGGGGGGAVTVADGADEALGATSDAAAAQGSTGTVSAKLRLVTSQLNTLANHLDGVESALAGLALESGGNLAAAAASLSALDDWDESDRAKVNPVVGQAGISAGAGAVAANTPRVTVASDDPLVTRVGEVQAAPTANTVLDRLKALLTGIVLAAGDNLIGRLKITDGTDVAQVTAAGDLRVNAIPNSPDPAEFIPVQLTDGAGFLSVLAVKQSTGEMFDVAGGNNLMPKFAAIAAATSGNNELVGNVAGRKIRVLAMFILAGAAGNVYFTSDAGGTVIFGGSTNKINLAANGGFVLPFNPVGWFETSVNQDLVLNASSTGPFSGGLVYVEV